MGSHLANTPSFGFSSYAKDSGLQVAVPLCWLALGYGSYPVK